MKSILVRTVASLGLLALLGVVSAMPPRTRITGQTSGEAAAQTGVVSVPGAEGTSAVNISTEGLPPAGSSGPECSRARNGGSTDTGVTADRIRLASTVVLSGPGSSFLSASPVGMQAVVRKVNRAGGICGRILDLTLRDDGWDKERGAKFLRAFINEGYFALPVVPSSEGLTAAIENGDIGKASIPTVGSDGMLIQQYQSPWVWPVASATVTTMRVMGRYGYEKGARTFAIVYDRFYRFGVEGADAFRRYVKTLPGASVKADVGILPAQASYSAEIQQFNEACGGECDFVAMLLEPQTALTWIAGRPQFGLVITSGAQTLFNEQFAANCGKPCAGMIVWTGYNPPIGNFASLKDVSSYINDVRSVSPTVDVTNQFLEGSYLGMNVFVKALETVGPSLTRSRLRQVLNSMSYQSDFASVLSWTETRRFANQKAQGFEIIVAQGTFAGFRDKQTGFISDPSL